MFFSLTLIVTQRYGINFDFEVKFDLEGEGQSPPKLEQLEHLHCEDTPSRLMITHTIESYWIPSQMKTKSK